MRHEGLVIPEEAKEPALESCGGMSTQGAPSCVWRALLAPPLVQCPHFVSSSKSQSLCALLFSSFLVKDVNPTFFKTQFVRNFIYRVCIYLGSFQMKSSQ